MLVLLFECTFVKLSVTIRSYLRIINTNHTFHTNALLVVDDGIEIVMRNSY